MTFSKKNPSTPLHSTPSTELFKIFFSLLTLSTAFFAKNRKKYRLAIHLMTGYIALNLHLNKIGIVDSDLCSMCNLETENVDHYLAKCPIFYNQ